MTPPPAEKVAEPFTGPFRERIDTNADDDDAYVVCDAAGKVIGSFSDTFVGASAAKAKSKWLCTRLNAAAPAPSVAQSERKAFEAWALEAGFYLHAHEHVPGNYGDSETQSAWLAWQARASAGSARVDANYVASLVSALTKYAVVIGVRLTSGGGEVFNSMHCRVCDAESDTRELTHKPTCVLAAHTHSAPPALTEEETTFMKALDGFMANQGDPWQNFKIVGLKAIITRLTS